MKELKKKVIYTCLTANYDKLFDHKYINQEWDYVCFTDNEDLKKNEFSSWQIKPLCFDELDDVRNQRWHKMHPHILFPEYEESLYLDTNIDILDKSIFEDIEKVKEQGARISLGPHFERSNLYDEMKVCEVLGKDDSKIIKKQEELIRESGFTGEYGVFFENNIIYRNHNDLEAIKAMEDWWWWVENYSRRDQLSLIYVLWKNKMQILPLSKVTYRDNSGVKFVSNKNHVTKEELLVQRDELQKELNDKREEYFRNTAHSQQLFEKKEKSLQKKVHDQSVLIANLEKNVYEMRTSLRWKVPNFIFKIYKNKIKKIIPKPFFSKIVNPSVDFFRKSSLKYEYNKSGRVDVIVPLYNGYDFFKECFDSLIETTNSSECRLIIVNDCSFERKTLEYIKKIREREIENVVILNNKKNLGFIGSVNRGMKYDKSNDVILLNSDTVLTEGWLAKMKKAAYSRGDVGTVTPISNNAALVSFPNQWEDNDIPKGQTLKSLSKIVEKTSNKIYPEIPSPVGFCMYIKRKVIDDVGFFDRIYGMGYGEENDFGMRAYRIGYRHILDDATFILHKGSMTFDKYEKKQELLEHNLEILHERYPELNGMLIKFNEKNTLLEVYNNIKAGIEPDIYEKKAVLYVLIDEVDNQLSGALVHVKNLIEKSGDIYNKCLLYRKGNTIFLVFYSKIFGLIRHKFSFENNFDHIKDFQHFEIEEIVKSIIKKFNIDIVHFQTPQDLPLSLISVAKKLGKRVFLTAHDYLLLCPNFTLTKKDCVGKFEFCNFEKNLDICKKCLEETMNVKNINDLFFEKRKLFISKNVLPFLDTIFVPSESLKNNLEKNLSIESKNKFIVIPHGVGDDKFQKKEIIGQDILRIAHVGVFSEVKGSRNFGKIAELFANSTFVEFFIIGKIDDWETLNKIEKYKNVKILGAYKNPKELNKIFESNKINLVLLLSIWPETFSYTLSEAWLNGIPVISFDLGAQSDRINKFSGGWTVSLKESVKGISDIINDIIKDKKVVLNMAKRIKMQKTETENVREYQKYYSGL